MRRILSILLVCAILACTFPANVGAVGEENENPEQEYISVYVDDVDVDPDRLAYKVDNALYVPLQSVAEELGCWFFTWNSALQSASLMTDDLFLTVSVDDNYLTANGRSVKIPDGLQIKEGVPMVPIKQLCIAFEVGLDIDEESAVIDPEGEPPVEYSGGGGGGSISGGSGGLAGYNDDDLYWLSHIIYAEAGGESFEGMIAVGNVVLNRVASSSFPNTVYGVIFDNNCGIQFSPAYSGSIYREPSEDAIRAAKLALEGENVVGNSLYFNPASRNSWASRNRPFVTQIGSHCFYA